MLLHSHKKIVDATFISLYHDAKDVYTVSSDDQARLQVHFTESLSTGLPARIRMTDGTTHERSQLATGEWVADALILFDLGFYDFWLFDRIDSNDGWFVFRLKSNANPKIVEELRTWLSNSITLEGKSLKAVLDDPKRQEIDLLVKLEFDRTRCSQ
jgi:putative transposase